MFFITFLLYLPLSTVFATPPELSLASTSSHSIAYYNLALKKLNTSELGFAKSYTERSLFLNPTSSLTQKLNSKITERLSKSLDERKREELTLFTRFLDFIPFFFSYIFLIFALFLLLFCLAKLRFIEQSSFKNNPKLRLKATGLALFAFCALLLYLAKENSQKTKWACVLTPETALFTGPDPKQYVQTTSLPQGSCVQVVSQSKNWISLKPAHHPPGWTNHNDVMIVRGDKFDPPHNKD